MKLAQMKIAIFLLNPNFSDLKLNIYVKGGEYVC